MVRMIKIAIIASVFGASALTSMPTFAEEHDYTCTGMRGCQNFASACAAASGDHSVDTPSTPGGGPIVNHCRVDEAPTATIEGLRAAGGGAGTATFSNRQSLQNSGKKLN